MVSKENRLHLNVFRNKPLNDLQFVFLSKHQKTWLKFCLLGYLLFAAISSHSDTVLLLWVFKEGLPK